MKWLNFLGVGLVLAGSVLLYFFGVPWKQINGGVLFGPFFARTSESHEAKDWRPEVTIDLNTSRRYSRLGFAFIAIGSALQLIAIAAS